ncbi:MAG TPA: glycosyltransferase family 39 protein [Nitrospirota bacterium]|nr:glycosyltransferase family 39 protein [Nitrospirota bacterium]
MTVNAFKCAYHKNRAAIWLIAAFTGVRLLVAPTFGLGTDEAHYVLYAKYLDLSYFDHPPLVGWTHALFYYTFGTNEFLARLPAILLFTVTSFLCYRFTLLEGGERTALLATAALNSSFLLSGLGLMLLPESLLLALVFALIYAVRKLERSPDLLNFVLLGLILGLAGLTKYTAILFVPAIAFYAVIKRRYDILFNPRLLISAAVAFIFITPVIYWNVQNGLISIRYQIGHVLGSHSPSFGTLLASLAAQFGAYSPPLFCLAFYGLYASLKSLDDLLLLPVLIGGSVLLFSIYESLFKFTLPHWSAVFYAIFIPLGVVMMDNGPVRAKRSILLISLGFSITVALLLQAEVAVKAFRFPDYKSPFRTVYGLKDVVRRANDTMAKDPSSDKALAVLNWTDVSRTLYYNLPFGSKVFLVDKHDERFSRWITGSPIGLDILFINNHFHGRDIGNDMRCREARTAGRVDILLNGGKVDTVDFIWCRSFGGVKPGRE